uniref:E3 ubiquitin-protein ligase TRIM39-like isoform X2 n=1 Tax=Monopterus albus TaxID=43700 RepID=UPI0009B4749A|nr:E3 ubiquitin-protein ligase TRIM39-like isoform X2 [Monopterus albus]
MTTETVRNVVPMPLEEHVRCCICLDIYTDPVTIPCGHNFCLDCIKGFWDTKDKWECPLCKEAFRCRPELRINPGFADIIEFFKRSLLPTPKEEEDVSSDQLSKTEEALCDVCLENKSSSVKSCLFCQASYCEIHLAPHLTDPTLQKHWLTDPATSQLCRKHNEPLTMFCKNDHTPVCVKCTEKEHKQHRVVPVAKESNRIKTNVRETKSDMQQMIQDRLRKIEEIKNSVDLSKKITEKEIQSSSQVCTLLITTIQTHQAGLLQELKERQEEAERRADELLDKLQQEISELQMRSSKLQDLELTQNPLHVLQNFLSLGKLSSMREWSKITVHSDNCMETVRKYISKLVDICQGIEKKFSAEVSVTLDPETASVWLILSPDRKKVSLSSQKKTPLPDTPQRFDSCVCVLGKQSFTFGRSYWVVHVGDKSDWDLGVARESINRKGAITVRPDSGYWVICRRKGSSLSACTSPSIPLHLQETPQKVGIFLDYEGGLVSFYDVEAKTHIYTYSGCTFTEPLYPYFNPCVQDNGKNTAPLVICPLEGRIREGQDITTELAT